MEDVKETGVTYGWFSAAVIPPLGQKVLMFTKWGNIWTGTFRNYEGAEGYMFSPDALKLGRDVHWWMPIPEDGWHRFADEKPPLNTWALVKELYGTVRSAKWCFALSFQNEADFWPFIGDKVCYWREMPALPPGVNLKEHRKW